MSTQVPPWLREELTKFQQSQQNLQSILTQLHGLDVEAAEIKNALEELKKTKDDDVVYKHVGIVMIKTTKQELVADLEERQEMSKTRSTILHKQETRLRETLKEQEKKLTAAMQGGAGASVGTSQSSPNRQSTQSNPDVNPRR